MHTRVATAAILVGVLASSAPALAGGRSAGGFALRAGDFANGAPIPLVHASGGATCPGQNGLGIEPTLRWSGAPAGTRSFALQIVDPDARVPRPGFVHWVAYDIPATFTTLGPASGDTYTQGTNGAGVSGYIGPCPPPPDPPHHYQFSFYALDLPRLPGAALNQRQLQAAIKGHVLGVAFLVGTFKHPATPNG